MCFTNERNQCTSRHARLGINVDNFFGNDGVNYTRSFLSRPNMNNLLVYTETTMLMTFNICSVDIFKVFQFVFIIYRKAMSIWKSSNHNLAHLHVCAGKYLSLYVWLGLSEYIGNLWEVCVPICLIVNIKIHL